VHVYIQYICFMFASSCKHPISWRRGRRWCAVGHGEDELL